VYIGVQLGNVVWMDKIGAMRAMLKLSHDAADANKDYLPEERNSIIEDSSVMEEGVKYSSILSLKHDFMCFKIIFFLFFFINS